jgi:hypothetical protein
LFNPRFQSSQSLFKLRRKSVKTIKKSVLVTKHPDLINRDPLTISIVGPGALEMASRFRVESHGRNTRHPDLRDNNTINEKLSKSEDQFAAEEEQFQTFQGSEYFTCY